MPVEEDGLDVGFTTYDYGCNVCLNKGWTEDGKPIRYAIVRRGNLMCCERCGGCYGSVPAGVTSRDGQTFCQHTPWVSGDSEATKEKG